VFRDAEGSFVGFFGARSENVNTRPSSSMLYSRLIKIDTENYLYTNKLTTIATHNNKDTAVTCVTVVTQQ
jgi:hypothetical protein